MPWEPRHLPHYFTYLELPKNVPSPAWLAWSYSRACPVISEPTVLTDRVAQSTEHTNTLPRISPPHSGKHGGQSGIFRSYHHL